MPDNVMLSWALYYAQEGLHVLPCEPRGKKPLTAHGVKDASSDEAQIRAWWTQWPGANIGISMGTGSGLIDVETDVKPDLSGEQSLRSWADSPGGCKIPRTWSFQSGGGGIHRLFRCGVPDLGNRANLFPAVDVRGSGGYAIFPPSIHPSGRRYAWVAGSAPSDTAAAPLPMELLSAIRDNGRGQSLQIPEAIQEGGRNDMLFRTASKLRNAGLSETEILASLTQINAERCSPPLEPEELEQICHSAARYKRGETITPAPVSTGSIISAGDLMGQQFRQLNAPVSGLICEGLTLLVAASKIGKSWWALLMGACVASGEPFLERPTQRCRVLYLALEDSQRRLQHRLQQLAINPIPADLYLTTQAPLLGSGLEEYLEGWLQQDTTLPAMIIVDTLQKVRGLDTGSKQSVYATDYDAMGKLKTLADKHRAAIVCIHHSNKARNVSDPYDKISGSNALMGAADTTILLTRDRGSDTATVSFTGRDVWGEDFTVKFENGRWILVNPSMRDFAAWEEYKRDPLVLTIRALIKENPTGGRWTYSDLKVFGEKSLQLSPFSSSRGCAAKLENGLGAQLLRFDKLSVVAGVRVTGSARGVEITHVCPDVLTTNTTKNPP